MNITKTDPVGLQNSGARRLPVYFMLDFSGAAHSGFASEAEQQVQTVISQLETQALQDRAEYDQAPVFYTIIVFRSRALQLHPLAPAGVYRFADLRLGEIEPQGDRGLGAAWDAMKESIEQELKMPGADNGDFRPLVFLFTDKTPADQGLPRHGEPMEVFVCGCEPSAEASGNVAGPFPEFLPLHSPAQILDRLAAARNQLKCRPHMIDYPLNY